MKDLVSRVEKTVLRPTPIRKLDSKRLRKEIANLERLLKQSHQANQAQSKDALEQQASTVANGEGNPPKATEARESVIGEQLLNLLSLRLQLCRTELSRRRLARKSIPNR